MKAIVRHTQLRHKFKRDIHAPQCIVQRVCTVVPRTIQRRRAEWVCSVASKRMPVAHGKSQPVSHRSAFDDFGGVVMPEREWVFGLRTFELDFIDFWKICGHELVTLSDFLTRQL